MVSLPPNCKQFSFQEKIHLADYQASKQSNDSRISFFVYAEEFLDILGSKPDLTLEISHDDYPFAHEACVYVPSLDSVFVTSNRYRPNGNTEGTPTISISKLTRSGQSESWQREKLSTNIAMGNGGVNYQDGILVCDQGNLDAPGGLIYMEAEPPYRTTPILEHYHGRIFNSINDVVVHSDGSIWFTDPCYGWKQGFRPVPTLPNQVYRFDPVTGDIKPVAWGFKRPNGLCFSPDENIIYITDTGAVAGGGEIETTGPRNIFAFDVMTSSTTSRATFLGNRRLFAMADNDIPDGIKCDTKGNVYSGCGDGVNVWNPDGVLIGKILVQGGVTNFCFGKPGKRCSSATATSSG